MNWTKDTIPKGNITVEIRGKEKHVQKEEVAIYFVEIANTQKGPYTKSKVFELWVQGVLNGNTVVWNKENSNFTCLKDCPEFKDDLPPSSLPKVKTFDLYGVVSAEKEVLPEIPQAEEFPEVFSKSEELEKVIDKPLVRFGKNAYISLALGIVSVVFIWAWISSQIKRPDGMSNEIHNVLNSVIKINPYKSLKVKSLFDHESGVLWLSSNMPNGNYSLQIESIQGKVLNTSSIKAKAQGKVLGHYSKIDVFTFKSGTQLYPGYYKVIYDITFDKRNHIIKDEIFIGERGLGERSFQENLVIYNNTVKKVLGNYKKEISENYDTLSTVLGMMEKEFNKVTKNISSGREIFKFQKFYVDRVGPFLTQFTVSNFKKPENVVMDFSRIASEYRNVFTLSKGIAGLGSEIMDNYRGQRYITKGRRKYLNTKFSKKFSEFSQKIQKNLQGLEEIKTRSK